MIIKALFPKMDSLFHFSAYKFTVLSFLISVHGRVLEQGAINIAVAESILLCEFSSTSKRGSNSIDEFNDWRFLFPPTSSRGFRIGIVVVDANNLAASNR